MRRTASLVVTLLLAAAVVIALGLRSGTSGRPQVASAKAAAAIPTSTTVSTTDSSVPVWSVAFSRADAVTKARAMNLKAADPGNSYQAKLVSWSEIGGPAGDPGPTEAVALSDRVWAVYVQGRFFYPFGGGQMNKWGIIAFSAQDGGMVAMESSTDTATASYWSGLPDHQPATG